MLNPRFPTVLKNYWNVGVAAYAYSVACASCIRIGRIDVKQGCGGRIKFTGYSCDLQGIADQAGGLRSKFTTALIAAHQRFISGRSSNSHHLDMLKSLGAKRFRGCVERERMPLLFAVASVWSDNLHALRRYFEHACCKRFIGAIGITRAELQSRKTTSKKGRDLAGGCGCLRRNRATAFDQNNRVRGIVDNI